VTTARYAHLAVDPIRAASNLISAEIDAAMNNRKPASKPFREDEGDTRGRRLLCPAAGSITTNRRCKRQ
jgi:hypothetical protein